MIEQGSRAQVVLGLRNELRTFHLGVPRGTRVDRDPQPISLGGVSWVLERRRKSEVARSGLVSVDVLKEGMRKVNGPEDEHGPIGKRRLGWPMTLWKLSIRKWC